MKSAQFGVVPLKVLVWVVVLELMIALVTLVLDALLVPDFTAIYLNQAHFSKHILAPVATFALVVPVLLASGTGLRHRIVLQPLAGGTKAVRRADRTEKSVVPGRHNCLSLESLPFCRW